MKTFAIIAKYYTTIIVTADNGEQALEWAAENVTVRGVDMDEMGIDRELKSDHEISRAVESSEYHGNDFHKKPYRTTG